MPSSPRTSRRSGLLPELEPDSLLAVRRAVVEALLRIVAVVASTSPMSEMHRGAPPPARPRSSDEALELLRASRQTEVQFEQAVGEQQRRWAFDAVMRGARISEVAEALAMTGGAVSRRWPGLAAMRTGALWFRDRRNAADWAGACVELGLAASGVRQVSELSADGLDDGGPGPEVRHVADLGRAYLDAAVGGDFDAVLPEWCRMVESSPASVETLVNPRLTKAVRRDADEALERLRLVWRAYRAGISLDDQIERDEHDRADRDAIA